MPWNSKFHIFLYLATDVCEDISDATDELDSDNDRRVLFSLSTSKNFPLPYFLFPTKVLFDLRFECFRFLKTPAKNSANFRFNFAKKNFKNRVIDAGQSRYRANKSKCLSRNVSCSVDRCSLLVFVKVEN